MTPFAAFAPRARRYAARHPLAPLAAASWLVGAVGVRTARFQLRWPTSRPGTPAEAITLMAEDGSTVAALFWPGASATAPGLVMVPGLGTIKEVIAPNAAAFAAAGYAVLVIEMRGHGRSSPARHSCGWHESLDLHAAVAWLKQRQGGAKVAVLGISMGAAAALVGPRGPVAADALILQAPFADLRRAVQTRIALVAGQGAARRLEPLLSMQARMRVGVGAGRIAPLAAFASYPRPALVVGGGRDAFVPTTEIEEFVAVARGPCEMWIAPGLGHNGVSDTRSPAYRARVLDFLARHLGHAVTLDVA